ncbi:hypothetical protein FisN_3Hu450 [Fistulifera solaris]|uniref:Uncharacterized protein n=1 Tax=Fistulifera solaris TaxID=1519565 RepID=A0A1Z5K7Z0_FISSO|nr:hypothetical protein FisN_3Hu450 [Fistulifera solaris]|eukprot:GAX22344.1 hypothetical protein FisN_3Hu450 [Fistulifera solaris]
MVNGQTVKVLPKKTSSSQRRPVVVINSGQAFPLSAKPSISVRTHEKQSAPTSKSNKTPEFDFSQASQEIRHFGSKQFAGKSKKEYEDEQYFKLTGRKRKKHQVPLPIVRGIKKKAAEREARAREEAKQAGIVLPQPKKAKKEYDNTTRVHGPAPSVGFMKKGILRVKDKV